MGDLESSKALKARRDLIVSTLKLEDTATRWITIDNGDTPLDCAPLPAAAQRAIQGIPRLVPAAAVDVLVRQHRTCFTLKRADYIRQTLQAISPQGFRSQDEFISLCETVLAPGMVREATRETVRLLHRTPALPYFTITLLVTLALPGTWLERSLRGAGFLALSAMVRGIGLLTARHGDTPRHTRISERDITRILVCFGVGAALFSTPAATNPLALGVACALIAESVWILYSYIAAHYGASWRLGGSPSELQGMTLWTMIQARHLLVDHKDALAAGEKLIETARLARVTMLAHGPSKRDRGAQAFRREYAEALARLIAGKAHTLAMDDSAAYCRATRTYLDFAIREVAAGRWMHLSRGPERAQLDPPRLRGRKLVRLGVRLVITVAAAVVASDPGGWASGAFGGLQPAPVWVFVVAAVSLSVLDYFFDGAASAGVSTVSDITALK